MLFCTSGVFAAISDDADDTPARIRDAVAQIVVEADSGKDPGAIITSTADLGVDAAIECARFIDPTKPKRTAALLEVISRAAQSRRSNRELLKLYDPSAYRLFYTEAGAADQRAIGKALALETWSAKTPEAMVRGAPLPTLEWLKQQAAAEKPRLPELINLLQTWAFWARVGHERQYQLALDEVARLLSKNRAILADDNATAMLVRFAGEVHADSATPFVVDTLSRGSTPARAAAAAACGRLISDATLAALVKAASDEKDSTVQQKIAMAAEEWHDRAEVGAAMLALFNRTTSAAVRREILFSCASATWPVRGELLMRAFDVPADGVLGAALIAMAAHPEPAALEKTLELARHTEDAQPPLIDALAAYGDGRAMRHLIRWLSKQENPAVKVKIILAIEKTSKNEADALLLQLANGDISAMVVEQSLGVIGRKRIAGGEDILLSLASDASAPIQVRIEAIWAMGRFDTPDVRAALNKFDENAEQHFKVKIDAHEQNTPGETIDMVRIMVALAKIQLRMPDGDAKLLAAYERGTGTAQLTSLIMLALLNRDHPIIAKGLASTDTSLVLGAARAALASDPKKYHAKLVAIRRGKFIDALLNSGLDSASLRETLDAAIAAGEKP